MTDTLQNPDNNNPSPAPSPTPAPAPAPSPTPDPTPAPSPTPGDNGTILEPTDKTVTLPADFPADWREKLSAGDTKVKTQLDRFASPQDMAKKILAQEATITRLTSQKGGLPKDATPEQVAEYRKVNDIPESPEKYNLNLPDGLVIGESDMPIVQGIAKALHGVNATQGQLTAAIAEYYRQEKAFLTERDNQIASFRTQQDDTLHTEWGNDYRVNMNLTENFLHTMPQEFQDIVAGGFDQNGMPLKYNAEYLKGLMSLARTINPLDAVVGGGGSNQMSAVGDRIAVIEKRMQDDRDGYFKDEKMQEEYRNLLAWKEKNSSQAA